MQTEPTCSAGRERLLLEFDRIAAFRTSVVLPRRVERPW